jgi:flagellin-like protein
MSKKMKGVSAIIATILMLMITIALAGMAYMYITGIFTSKTGIVLEIDSTATKCVGTTISIYVRDTGTLPTTADKVLISGTNSAGVAIAQQACGLVALQLTSGGGSVLCTNTLTGTQGTNSIVVAGPSNTVRGTAYCP